jgi:hypothetical protein
MGGWTDERYTPAWFLKLPFSLCVTYMSSHVTYTHIELCHIGKTNNFIMSHSLISLCGTCHIRATDIAQLLLSVVGLLKK